jgi:5'(3')-deoxyribonucleotidase
MCEAIKKAYNNLNVNMHSAVDGEVNKTLESLEWTTEFGCIWKCRIIFCIRKNTQKIRLLLMKTANNQKEELIKVLNGIEIYISANAGGKKGA